MRPNFCSNFGGLKRPHLGLHLRAGPVQIEEQTRGQWKLVCVRFNWSVLLVQNIRVKSWTLYIQSRYAIQGSNDTVFGQFAGNQSLADVVHGWCIAGLEISVLIVATADSGQNLVIFQEGKQEIFVSMLFSTTMIADRGIEDSGNCGRMYSLVFKLLVLFFGFGGFGACNS